MTRTFRLPTERPLLDIGSFARGGPGRRDKLTPAQLEHIRRTVRRVPEVVVKVLSRGSNDLKAAAKHLDYIVRYGELELEGNDGERWQGRVGKALLHDWALELDELRPRSILTGGESTRQPKLIHKLMFSMPPGTPPDKVLVAVRNLAREEFGLKHRYAFVLHTDEPHPHIHLMLKAVSEQGVRLNIKKATLRHWRSEFARHLRAQGVSANSTERAVRGNSQSPLKDRIYRADIRGVSTHMLARRESASTGLPVGVNASNAGHQLSETRGLVSQGWLAVASTVESGGQYSLAAEVRRFLAQMSPPSTDQQLLSQEPTVGSREPRWVSR